MLVTNTSIDLFEEVIKSAKIIGPTVLKKIVIKSRIEHQVKTQEALHERLFERNITLVKKLVCKKFNITLADYTYGKSQGNRIQAIMVSLVVFEKVLNLSMKQISENLGKDLRNMRRLKAEYNKLKPDNKYDNVIITKCNEIIAKAAECISINNQES